MAIHYSFPLAYYNLVLARCTTGAYTRPKLSVLLIHLAEAEDYFTNLHITATCESSHRKTQKGILYLLPRISAALHPPLLPQAGSSGSSASCQAEDRSLFTELCLEEAERISVSSPAALSSQLPRTVLKGFGGSKI